MFRALLLFIANSMVSWLSSKLATCNTTQYNTNKTNIIIQGRTTKNASAAVAGVIEVFLQQKVSNCKYYFSWGSYSKTIKRVYEKCTEKIWILNVQEQAE
jgi:hypothetical protein